ncbi:MAG: Acrylyl-CoA reductase AcuI [Gammaproteobacteria bacterium]|nr:Acrylyl-CoA reductase AcuI [Gammaproteobacteria bacterium]
MRHDNAADSFRALLATGTENGPVLELRQLDRGFLMEGDVTIAVDYSTLNYKDGLALTGGAPILRVSPMIPGVDLAGIVESSRNPDFMPGDKVILNGWGVGERHHGGYAQLARVRGEWLIPLPERLSTRQAMAIGTAGYTAMLCIMALEDDGLRPDGGPVLVTGAAGGVGSIAVSLLAGRGYTVTASTGRVEEAPYLQALGASTVVARGEFQTPVKPLAKERWAGAVDAVGGTTLANVLSQMRYGGRVTACGLAGGMDLPATVAPFILRGVRLLGVDSVMAPRQERLRAWQRLASEIDPGRLESMTRTIPIRELPAAAADILAGRVRGRIVVDVNA